MQQSTKPYYGRRITSKERDLLSFLLTCSAREREDRFHPVFFSSRSSECHKPKSRGNLSSCACIRARVDSFCPRASRISIARENRLVRSARERVSFISFQERYEYTPASRTVRVFVCINTQRFIGRNYARARSVHFSREETKGEKTRDITLKYVDRIKLLA